MTRKLLICGVGRCGTSLVMQMLKAAGLRVPGEHPFHEFEDGAPDGWEDQFDAVKWLAPGRATEPLSMDYDWRALWLTRNPLEQAKSWVKFSQAQGVKMSPYPTVRLQEALVHIATETAEGIYIAARTAGAMRVLAFETVLQQPLVAARAIAEMWGAWDDQPSSVRAMVDTVEARGPACASEMESGKPGGRRTSNTPKIVA